MQNCVSVVTRQKLLQLVLKGFNSSIAFIKYCNFNLLFIVLYRILFFGGKQMALKVLGRWNYEIAWKLRDDNGITLQIYCLINSWWKKNYHSLLIYWMNFFDHQHNYFLKLNTSYIFFNSKKINLMVKWWKSFFLTNDLITNTITGVAIIKKYLSLKYFVESSIQFIRYSKEKIFIFSLWSNLNWWCLMY